MLVSEESWSDDAVRMLPIEDDRVQNDFGKFHKFERDLFTTKWFDYRCMTPTQATDTYMREYARVYQHIYGRELDFERAEHIQIPDMQTLITRIRSAARTSDKKKHNYWKAELSGYWRGRQVADAIGVPYGVYIDLAFTFRMRRWPRDHMPRPYQLYHEYDVEKIQARWEEMQQSQLFTSEHPAYLVQNYQGIALQNDYHEWLLKQALARSNPSVYLARFVNEDQLPLDKIEARIAPEMLEEVERYLN